MDRDEKSQVVFIRRAAEQDGSESARDYLFKEVSKLEASLQSSLLDTTSLSYLLEDGHSERAQNIIQVETVAKPPFGVHNPWLALSVINMQCERLINLEWESGSKSPICSIPFEYNSASVEGTSGCVEYTSKLPLSAAEMSPINMVDEHEGSIHKKCGKEFTPSTSPQMAAKEKAALSSSQPSKTEPAIGVDNLKGCHQSFFAKHHDATAYVSGSSMLHAHIFPHATVSLERSWPPLPFDQNANVILGCHSPEPNDYIVSSKSYGANVADWEHSTTTTVTSEWKSNGGNDTPITPPLEKSKKPRKQPNPRRSVDIQDPHFQGVTFRMDAKMDDCREQCRLFITSKYSKELCKSVRKRRSRSRVSQMTGSSDEESETATSRVGQNLCIVLHEKNAHVEGCRRWNPSLQCLWLKIQKVLGALY
ncbi:GATA-type zinc finger protein 1 isoform X2 [Stigmatopora argus]